MDEVSQILCKLLEDYLYPNYIQSKEDIALVSPYLQDKDYQVGIMLYDMMDTQIVNNSFVYKHGKLHYPPKNIELFYVMYVNMANTFGGINARMQQKLLTKIIQILYDNPYLMIKDIKSAIWLENLALDDKIRLWQSFSKPLQPAIYIKVSPVQIQSLQEKQVTAVQDMEVKTYKKEG